MQMVEDQIAVAQLRVRRVADRIALITSASISGAGTRAIDPRLGLPLQDGWET